MEKKYCSKCGIEKNVIEFQYEYFKKRYSKLCNDCSQIQRPLELTMNINGRRNTDIAH